MILIIHLTRKNMQWLQKNARKNRQKYESTALDNWTSEGGSIAGKSETKQTGLKSQKPSFCSYRRKAQNDNTNHGHQQLG